MSENSPILSELLHSIREQTQLLNAASSIAATGNADVRDEVIREALLRGAEILRGATSLGSELNPACLGILARSQLEALISVLWNVMSTENALAHKNAAVAEMTRAFKINLVAGKAQVRNQETGEDATAEFLKSDKMLNIKKRKSVADQAAEAGATNLYNIFYRFLSLETHGHQMRSPGDDKATQLTVMHLQGIAAVSRAIGHVGVRWLLHRERTDNESLRTVLGLDTE